MRLVAVFIVLLFGLVARVQAKATLAVTSIVAEGGSVRISYTLSNWSLEDTGRSACGETRRVCNVFTEIRLVDSNNTGGLWTINVSNSSRMTLGDVIRELNANGVSMPYSGSTMITSAANLAGGCFALTTASGVIAGPAYDVTNCMPLRPPTPPVQCDIDGSTTIDHRSLSETALNNAQASTQLNVRCSASASVTVRATRTNSRGVRLRADESLYSVVTINNRDATGGINVTTTNTMSTPITVMSTLNTQGTVAPGAFSGSTVITVSPN